MILAAVTLAMICPMATPSPTETATPLQVIGHVRATLLCSGLRNKIGPSIVGLRVNDKIISQGQIMMNKARADALTDPRSGTAVGGAGSSSEMDDFQMTAMVQALSDNLRKVDALLDDSAVFPQQAKNDDERALDLAKARLEAVAVGQRSILNILATTSQSNEANDLRSKCDPVDCPSGGSTPARLSLPKALATAIGVEQTVENAVTPAIVALVQQCLQK